MARQTERDTCLLICFSLGTVDAPLKPQASWRLGRDEALGDVHGCLLCRRCRSWMFEMSRYRTWGLLSEPQALRSETPSKRRFIRSLARFSCLFFITLQYL